MKKLLKFTIVLSSPLVFFHIVGGVVSGIWLLAIGQRATLLLGVSLFLLCTFISYFICETKIGIIKTFLIVSFWCFLMSFIFISSTEDTKSNLLANLILSYGVATGPWLSITLKKRKNLKSLFAISVIDLFYLILIFFFVFKLLPIMYAVGLIASIIIIGIVVLIADYNRHEPFYEIDEQKTQPSESDMQEFAKRMEKFKKEREAKRPERETDLWVTPLTLDELQRIRHYILAELYTLEATDWGYYALRFICNHSPKLTHFIVDGELNLEHIRDSEVRGIKDTIDIIQKVEIKANMTLRAYFHKIFEEIYRNTTYSGNNKFYFYGRNRVIEILRSYRASIRQFVPRDRKFYELEDLELTLDTSIDSNTIRKVQEALNYFEKTAQRHPQIEELKQHYRFKIESEYPIIEFDLEAIERAGNFTYSGSLVNSLYNELRRLLNLSADYTILGEVGVTTPLYDAHATSFAVGEGILILSKYKGAVEYFPDRLFVELRDIENDSWVMTWLKSYKMHLEGND